MGRCHLRCKNSLLLLKCKFLLKVGDKKIVFLIEFTFLFYFILFIYTDISISSLYGVTLWKLVFPFLVPHWILVVTFVCTVISPWFFSIWTLPCEVYRPYGLIFFANFIIVVLLRSVWRRLFSNVPVSYEQGHQRLCHVQVFVLRLVRLLIFYGMFCE
jgi:hypothetical protein